MKKRTVYPIGIEDPVFNMNMKAYMNPPTSYDCLMRNHFNDEISTLEEYEGRELYELIQNADDAGASCLKIEIENSQLTISNDGNKPFTQDGYASIMRPSQSTKRDEKYIGYKGLGFRSVLNWCNSLTIKSRIAPYSSQGLACKFSQEIALKKYDELKKIWGKLEPNVEDIFKELIAKSKRKSPVPILAIPEVTHWIPSEKFTTQIVLDLSSNIVAKVKENMEMLNRSQFFLFLHNIRTIVLVINGQEATINWETKNYDNVEFVHVYNSSYDHNSQCTQRWIINRIHEEKISVAAARRIDDTSTYDETHNYFFHSFFPTKIKLSYGCVLHATVKLDKSRNHMLTTPERVLKLLAKSAIDLALSITKLHFDNPTWDGYDVIRPIIDATTIYPEFNTFNKALINARHSEPLCPTAIGKFIPLDKSIHIAEEFSEFAEDKKAYGFFNDVLKCGFKDLDINETFSFNYPQIEDFANPERNSALSDEDRVSYISILARLAHKTQVKNRTLKLLIDQNGCLITDKGLILTGRNETVPSIIKVKIIKEEIVLRLKEELDLEIKNNNPGEKDANRQLARYLEKICNVGYSDFNGIKLLLFNASRETRTKEQEIELVRYLYNQWKSSKPLNDNMLSDRDFVVPADEILYLLDSNKVPRQICNLLYGCESGKWAPYITNWSSELGLIDNEVLEIKKFLTQHLHMASNMPLNFIDWANYPNGYLEHFCPKDTYYYRRQEVKADTHSNKRMAFCVDDEFLKTKSPKEVIRLVVSDDSLFRIIHPGQRGEYPLYYFYYSLNTKMVSMSPCAFSMHDKIGELSSYVVNEKKWLGAELLNVLDFSTEEYERFVKLAILMGAKKDDSELTMEEIYENINNIPVENHNEMYKEYKDRLKGFSENNSVPPLYLWCTQNGQLLRNKIPSSECYYWDNTPPKAILSNFPLFDIGKREGEILVQKLFGVKPVSSIKCTPKKTTENARPEMTEEIRCIINERRKYFLAYRCENIRKSESRTDQIKSIFNTITNLKFEICSQLEYDIDKKSYTLDTGEYIIDPNKKYWIMLDYLNISEYPTALDTISSMLCNILRIEEKNWKSKFKEILLSNSEDLEKKLFSDFDTDYIDEIQNIMNGINVESVIFKQRISFEQLNNIIHKIETFKLCQLYEIYGKYTEQQLNFFDEWQKTEIEINEKALDYYNKSDLSQGLIAIEDLLLKEFGLKRIDVEYLERPIPLSEYKEWINDNFGDNFTIQKYKKIHSLSYFPGNSDEMKKLWMDIQNKNKISQEADTIDEVGSDGFQIPEFELISPENLHKPTPATGETTSLKHSSGENQRKNSSSKKAEGAERLVFQYLDTKGFKPIPRSSILDPNVEDIRHYDIEYTDINGKMHYVEVKSTSDGIIHFSEQEFAFASKHQEEYDLFIVSNGKIYSIEKAYDSIKRTVTPEQYKVIFYV